MKKIISSICMAALLYSCNGDYTEINKDPNSFYTTVPSTLVTYAQKQLTDYVSTPNVNTNNLRLTMQYWQEAQYSDESQYNFTSRNVADNVFLSLYVRTLKNLDEARKLIEVYSPTPGEIATWDVTKKNQLAIIDLMKIYTYQVSVDTFGNVPYAQSLDIDVNPLPAYEDAAAVYADLIAKAKVDVANLDVNGTSFASGDKFYSGSVPKWKKFGNSLMLKLGIAIADSNADLAKSTVQAAISGGVFTSSTDDCLLPYVAANPNWNPIYANVNPLASGRQDFVAGKTLVDVMNASNDPRRASFFQQNLHYSLGQTTAVTGSTITFNLPATPPAVAPKVGDRVFKGNAAVGTITALTANTVTLSGFVPGSVSVDDTLGFSFFYKGGTIGLASSYNTNSWAGTFAQTATTPGILMNYTEVAFYLAEASARWGLGDAVEVAYGKAVTSSLKQWGLTDADAVAYLASHPYDSTNWKKSIGSEAWIAMYNQPMQGWNFYRRLDYPVLAAAQGAIGEANGKVPVRLKYPVTEQTTNPTNYAAASAAIGGDFLYTKIFWDKF